MVTNGARNVKITDELIEEINKLDKAGAPYTRKPLGEVARETQEKELGLGSAQQTAERNGKINGKNIEGMEPTVDDPEAMIETMAQTKLRKETALAHKAELDAAEREGRLIPREETERLWRDIGVRVQKAILSIPDRLAPVMAGESDGHKIHRLMTAELKYALRNLSQNISEEDNGEGKT
jgi:phage terminase Nu1 subunit (DNA packaging protein)